MESSPRRRGSFADLQPQQPPPTSADDWSNSFPRPKSSINRTSTSGTMSDRSPGDYSTPRLLSANNIHRTYQEVSQLDSTSTASTAVMSAGGFSIDPIPNERVRIASALRRSREPSPVTVVTDFITTGPYR